MLSDMERQVQKSPRNAGHCAAVSGPKKHTASQIQPVSRSNPPILAKGY